PPEDSRSEASSTKEKVGTSTSNGKRRAGGNPTPGSLLRDAVTAGQTSITGPAATGTESAPGIQWSTLDSSILHGYRYDYRLNTPSAFKEPGNQLVLSQSSIGRMSPTMARYKGQRRQSKEQLANAVRKHFNSMGISENDTVVDFLYKVRWQDKNFRMRFSPPRHSREKHQ
ncbi:hypothetical protein B0O99DRAFT_493794, partial [Bisporella sp. PMI_857]